MHDNTLYKQCKLQRVREAGQGVEETTTWIPTRYAFRGKILSLKDKNGEWSRDWKVIQADTSTTEEVVDMYERQHRWTREASDI